MARPQPPVVGIFVGGKSIRMGGQAKGLLRAPDGQTILERWVSVCGRAGLDAVLVGDAGPYEQLGVPAIADLVPGRGPLGGLAGLLAARPEAHAVAVACDMPRVTVELLARLAFADSAAAVLAPVENGLYQPLFARYERARVLPLAERQLREDDRSLQKLIRGAGADTFALALEERRQLDDWDTPGDIEDSGK
jgi:molybdopterin-guanine dinucleotide biosynthesis protein A